MTADSGRAAPPADAAKLRRDMLWNLAPVILLGVVGLGLNFVIAGGWGATALGVFNLVTMTVFPLAIIGAGGLQFAVLRAVAEAPDEPRRVAAVVVGALLPNLALAVVATALCLAMRPLVAGMLDSPEVAEGILWASPGVFAFSINKVLLGVVNGLGRMRAYAIYTSLRYVLIAASLGAAYATSLPGARLGVVWTITEGALLAVLLVELLATVRLRQGGAWRVHARAHLSYGARGIVATLAQEINSRLDVWMLGVALPEDQVGVYALASTMYEGALQLPMVLQHNLNPLLARHLATGEPEKAEELVARIRRWFVPATFAVCVISALAYPIVVPILVGDQAFAAGKLPFAILMAGAALASPNLPFVGLLLMAGRPGLHTWYMLAALAMAFVADLALIPWFGANGVAAGTALGLVGATVLLSALARSRLGLRI